MLSSFSEWFPILGKVNLFSKQEEEFPKVLKNDDKSKSVTQEVSGKIECESILKKATSSKCRRLEPTVLVHGGAGVIPDKMVPAKLNCVKTAAIAGYKVLRSGGSSAEAVEAAIRVMEDNPVMNAGYGSVLNYEGDIEADACIMVGDNLDAGGVAAVKDVANPISLAKLVMEKTPHVLLVGDGARNFAAQRGVPLAPPGSLITLAAKEALKMFKENPDADMSLENWDAEGAEMIICPRTESVGAVAIDNRGRIAAGASSGGWNGKIKGKFSEVCSIGGGIYADDKMGGVSLSGYGKYMVRMMLALQISKDMEEGSHAFNASRKWLEQMSTKYEEKGGGVAISKYGDLGIFFNTARMPWAYQSKNILYYGCDLKDVNKDIVC